MMTLPRNKLCNFYESFFPDQNILQKFPKSISKYYDVTWQTVGRLSIISNQRFGFKSLSYRLIKNVLTKKVFIFGTFREGFSNRSSVPKMKSSHLQAPDPAHHQPNHLFLHQLEQPGAGTQGDGGRRRSRRKGVRRLKWFPLPQPWKY